MNAGPRRARQAGFTLLEVLISVTLMAVLAVLCYRGLETILSARDRVTMQSDEMRALSLTFAQLDEDLRRSWSVRTLGQPQPPVMFMPGQENGPQALVVLRENGSGEPLQLQQVVYRVRNGVLERGFSRWRTSGFETAITLDRLSWQPLVNGIEGLAFRAYVPDAGWLAGDALKQLARPRRSQSSMAPVPGSPQLPPGVPPPTSGTPQLPPGAPVPPVATLKDPTGIEITLNRVGNRITRLFTIEY
ncbi:MAG: prepilin-type N-terminal cleavage/methylation domain-containing protein [Burkholderiaceae bacterium]